MDPSKNSASEVAAACRAGDRRALSRLISLLESDDAGDSSAALSAAMAFDLPRHVIGITGPPGAGKSTLIDYLATLMLTRSPAQKIAILAVDPSSPFTGGALLGDRIRMGSLRNEPRVFIRSMGSRGARGGLAEAANGALHALGGAGFDTVFLETVGAGQSETAITNLAHTVCVVQVPGFGDEVQLMKMGILEAADIFAVNKADKPEAAELKVRLEAAIGENPGTFCRVLKQLGKTFAAAYAGDLWIPPVVLLSASRRENGAALLDACDAHRAFIDQPSLRAALKINRAAQEILSRAERQFHARSARRMEDGTLANTIDAYISGTISIDEAADEMLKIL